MDCTRVIIRKVRNGYDVEADGRVAENLCWDEMLGQVATLTHGDIKNPRFRTVTPRESIAEDIKRNQPRPSPATCDILIDGVRCGRTELCDRADCEFIPF